MKVGILVNPKHARTMRAYGHLIELLSRRRVPYRSATTTPHWPGAQQTTGLLDWGADLMVVLGGDGTLRACATTLAGKEVPVLIIPAGTANVLSRHIGIRSSAHALHLVKAYLSGQAGGIRDVPVNEADCLTADGSRREHFLSLAGIGGDARTIDGRTRLPGLLGRNILGYACGAAAALFAELFTVEITEANDPPTADAPTQVWSVMASKTARPAGPIPVFDRAEPTTGEFEFLAVALTSTTFGDRLGEWAQIARDCVHRRPASNPAMRYWAGTGASIRLDAPEPVQLDGDLIGDCRRLDLRTGTRSLTLLGP